MAKTLKTDKTLFGRIKLTHRKGITGCYEILVSYFCLFWIIPIWETHVCTTDLEHAKELYESLLTLELKEEEEAV